MGGILLLAMFTVFITWRAKTLESEFHERDPAAALLHKKAPDFSLTSNDGRTISLADYRGKKNVVLSYWASWCGPCRLELPQLREFYKKFHTENSDFEVLAISLDDDKFAADEYARKEKLPFPILYDPGNRAADAYSVEVIPTICIVDKAGKVIYAKTGLEETMEIELAVRLGLNPTIPGVPAQEPEKHDSHN
ncbi:MAG TPA: TlpA disulfide reductase family protein [Terriglobales bacterium]|nr:TlpA disulfide reductase family protein [Terriglobales bacterium]